MTKEIKYKVLAWIFGFLLIVIGLYAVHNWLVNEILEINYVQAQEVSVERSKLEISLRDYLKSKNSPLVSATDTLITLPSWRRILALSNAESSFCKNLSDNRLKLHQCWGVGGSEPWDFGDNWDEAVVNMQAFLNNYPGKNNPNQPKYIDWTYVQMNGVYKQPAANHWLVNIYTIEEELKNIN